MDPDIVARLADASGRLFVGCGAETVSGTYYLCRRGDIHASPLTTALLCAWERLR
jgi:hypothetical protein